MDFVGNSMDVSAVVVGILADVARIVISSDDSIVSVLFEYDLVSARRNQFFKISHFVSLQLNAPTVSVHHRRRSALRVVL